MAVKTWRVGPTDPNTSLSGSYPPINQRRQAVTSGKYRRQRSRVSRQDFHQKQLFPSPALVTGHSSHEPNSCLQCRSSTNPTRSVPSQRLRWSSAHIDALSAQPATRAAPQRVKVPGAKLCRFFGTQTGTVLCFLVTVMLVRSAIVTSKHGNFAHRVDI